MTKLTKNEKIISPIDQILKPQTQLELIFNIKLITDFIDIRTPTIVDINPNIITITQSDPPIVKLMIRHSPEASDTT